MALSINTTLEALGAQRRSARSQDDLATAIARLSSGVRINAARDDAAGLAIVERFTSQIRGGLQAARNTNDGISLAQTAEGALGSIGENLQRMRELAVQAANATQSSVDRAALQREVAQLSAEIDRVATQTQFNGVNLLDGSFVAQSFQVGANAGQSISVPTLASARATQLGQYLGVNLVNQSIGSPTVALAHKRALTMTIGAATYALGTINVDASSIAQAINQANVPGLTATANPTVVDGANFSAATATAPSGTAIYTLNSFWAIPINGLSGVSNLAANRAAAVAAINAQSASHGIVATDVGTGVTLTAPDGRNITCAYDQNTFTGGWSENFGLPLPAIVGSTVNVSYEAPPGATGNLSFQQDTWNAVNGGFTNSTAIALTGPGVSSLDISTAATASAAITTLDRAIASVGSARAGLGAVQNRFSSVVATLQQSGANLSAARSRIQDADFAIETANLSRAQVLQEAGTAMVAQANQQPQQVLRLLR